MAGKKTGGLGRGLGSLFEDINFNPEAVSIEEPSDAQGDPGSAKSQKTGTKKSNNGNAAAPANLAENVVFVKLDDIKPNAKQPRSVFNEDALEELASSIKEYGVIQPVLLRPAKKGYELVAGERRWRAARKAGLKKIPAIVRELDERQNMYYALIENMQREDLNIIEEARGMEQMMNEYGLTQEQAAEAVGKSRSYVTNALRLLKLPQSIQDMISQKLLSMGHARAIAGLPSEELQLEAAEKAVKEGWSVRRIEGYTGEKKKRPAKKRAASRKKDPAVADIEERLSQTMGTRVVLNGNENSGKIELEYYSREELDRLLDLLMTETR